MGTPVVQKAEKKRSDKDRLAFLADRMAIMLVILKARYGDDWSPWFGEAMWESGDGMGEEIRSWPEYGTAKAIVRLFLMRFENEQE